MIISGFYSTEVMFLFRRKLFYHHHCSSTQDSNFFSSFCCPSRLFSSSSSTSKKSALIVDYLIKTVGLSPERAIKSSKCLAHLKSHSKPDAVLRFFKESGFSDAHIKSIVSKHSSLLTANVETTLKPKIISLKELGFSESEIHRLVSTNPIFLMHGDIHSKVNFWRSFLGSKVYLFKALVRGRRLICSSLDSNVMPKIGFLRDMGYSDYQIASMIMKNPNFIVKSLDSIKSLCKQAEEMGFSYGSCAFSVILIALCQISAETLNSKLKLLRSFGCSEAETSLAIRRAPRLLETSEKKMKVMMDFLVNQAGSEPSYIMKHPRLLMFSLTRRLIPRNHVMQLLREKVLLKRKVSLLSFMTISEKKFMEQYIMPYQEKMPEFHQIYFTLYAGSDRKSLRL